MSAFFKKKLTKSFSLGGYISDVIVYDCMDLEIFVKEQASGF